MLVEIHTIPKSKQPGVSEVAPGVFVVRVQAPPSGGQANEEVIERLAKHWKVAKSLLHIVRGKTHRVKIVQRPEV